MPELTRAVVQACVTCIAKTGPKRPQRHTLVSNSSSFPFEKMSLDIVGPMKTCASGNKYILTCKDLFTKWLYTVPIKNMTAETVLRALINDIFYMFGFCKSIHTDNGRQFVSHIFEREMQNFGIKHTMTPAYNPKSNAVERSHRDLNSVLRAMTKDGEDWDKSLRKATFTINTSKHAATGFSPFFTLFGYEPISPLKLRLGTESRTVTTPEQHRLQLLADTHQRQNVIRQKYGTKHHEKCKTIFRTE